MINFGIDLGTTNSIIAKFEKGAVEIFRNPMTLKQTLPSVVAFRKNKIFVGDKARELMNKDPKNVIGAFKRKMGTSESYPIESLQVVKTPIELSAQVLMELKNFVHTGEKVEAAVVTIPASFDTIQSNATMKAAQLAGLSHTILLQEPIAASLAYANKDDAAFAQGQWLVYDLGGGTFDVALVRIQDEEMRIIDHEGDNFLGGTDFDRLIVEEMVIPHLKAIGHFEDLERALKSASGRHNRLYNSLIIKAEEVKIALSNQSVAELELEIEDDNGTVHEVVLEVTRQQFEATIAPYIEQTIQQIQSILLRNNLAAGEIKFVLMVGGSTYIPYVQRRVEEALGVAVNCNIDPTTAVAVGAAYFAGSKPLPIQALEPKNALKTTTNLTVKMAYSKATQADSEFFAALVTGETANCWYRIVRSDGGFDSGLKPLQQRISENLNLLPNLFNQFELKIFDNQNNWIDLQLPSIGITHGKFSVVGQPLPNDICLEIDDFENNSTVLDLIFEKNSILPLKKTIIKTVTKTIRKGSDDRIVLNIVEGPSSALPAANQTIGFIAISGKGLTRDLVKGADVEITLEISESRELKVITYLMLTDQEFENIFTPSERNVDLIRLQEDFLNLYHQVDTEIRAAENLENYEIARALSELKEKIQAFSMRAKQMSQDDITDEKFQLEAKKREFAQTIDALTKDKFIIELKMAYTQAKRACLGAFEEQNNRIKDTDHLEMEQLQARERSTLASNSRLKIQKMTEEWYNLRGKILWRDEEYVKFLFFYVISLQDEFKDNIRGEQYINEGLTAIKNSNIDQLKMCVNALFALLPDSTRQTIERGGTGIG